MSNVLQLRGTVTIVDGESPVVTMAKAAVAQGAVKGFLIYENADGICGTELTGDVSFAHALGMMLLAGRMLEDEE